MGSPAWPTVHRQERRLELATLACERAYHLIEENKPLEALAAFDCALDANARSEPAIHGITMIAERLDIRKHSSTLEHILRRCLLSPLGNPDALTAPVGRLLQLKYGLPSFSEWSAQPNVTEAGLNRLFMDVLLLAYLSLTINQNLSLERFLVIVRACLADRFRTGSLLKGWQPLAAALAAQAHNNEYIWSETDEEARWVAVVKTELEACDWNPSNENAVRLFLIYAMFRPPDDLLVAREGLKKVSVADAPSYFRSLLELTVLEPSKCRALEPALQRLTAIDDPTSRVVRDMYEANPYPRWLHLPVTDLRFDPDELLRTRFPYLAEMPARDGPMQILMPGVGTGRQALWAATRYANVEITAVDISLRSLAYGRRMAEIYGVENIAFVQGDILSLEGQYDRIECTGVLHHLKDPEAGFRRLAACLKPGGVMQVMVYAAENRREIDLLRSCLDGSIGEANADTLRRVRSRIVGAHGDLAAFLPLAQRPDFHSASGFRDLVMHVHESAFTIARVKAMIETTDAVFIGFEFTSGRVAQMFDGAEERRLYRDSFPHETTLGELSNWAKIEASHPSLLRNYFFWCQRRALS